MSKHYKHISLPERREIYRLQGQGLNSRQIARILGRHTSSIYREVWRNTYRHEERDCGGYYPVTAQELAMQRRAKTRKLLRHDRLKNYIVAKLRAHWSPEQIAGYLRRVDAPGIRVCHETIYRHVYSDEGRTMGLYRHLFRCRKNRRRRFGRIARSLLIPFEHTIHARPGEVAAREVFGHWEGDLMIFERERGRSNVTSLVERKSRYVVLVKNDGRQSVPVLSGIGDRLGRLPAPARRTITFDRGVEFLRYPVLREKIGLVSYFCDPRSPWQKGAIENANARLRRFLPRETDIGSLSQADMERVCEIANTTPRKCLGYFTPKEVFKAHLQETDEPLPLAV
jgi:IS30 family transposase